MKDLLSIVSHFQMQGTVREIKPLGSGLINDTYKVTTVEADAPDYKAMYFELFRASVQAAQLLQDAQKRAEQHLLEADPPPIRLEQTEQTDEE